MKSGGIDDISWEGKSRYQLPLDENNLKINIFSFRNHALARTCIKKARIITKAGMCSEVTDLE